MFEAPTQLLLCAEDESSAVLPFQDPLVRWESCVGAAAGLAALEQLPGAAIISCRHDDEWALQFCRSARSLFGPRTPPLFVWAQAGGLNHHAVLEAGAIDLLEGRELDKSDVIRLWAHLRRPTSAEPNAVLRFGDLSLDLDALKVRRNGRTIPLSALQRRLLQIMLERPTHVFSHEELEEQLWNGREIDGANLRTCMRRLRHALNGEGEVELVRNVRQAGYVLAPE